MRFGSPLALPAQGQFTPGQVDGLGSFVGSGLTSFQTTITTINAYSEIVVRLSTAGNPLVYGATLQNQNSPTGAQVIYSAGAGITPGGLGTFDQEIIIPCNNSPGDTLTLTIICSAALNASQSINVYGNSGPSNLQIRPDGRTFPIGRYLAENSGGAGPLTLIGSTGANSRVMLKTLHASNSAPAGTSTSVQITVGGNTANIERAAISGNDDFEWESGLLLDINTSVILQINGAAFIAASAIYDIVPA